MSEEVMNLYRQYINRLKECLDRCEAENRRLMRVIARDLTENDELGCEYTYVVALKREVFELKNQLGYRRKGTP